MVLVFVPLCLCITTSTEDMCGLYYYFFNFFGGDSYFIYYTGHGNENGIENKFKFKVKWTTSKQKKYTHLVQLDGQVQSPKPPYQTSFVAHKIEQTLISKAKTIGRRRAQYELLLQNLKKPNPIILEGSEKNIKRKKQMDNRPWNITHQPISWFHFRYHL